MTDEAPRTGARQRRRGLYGPPPRLTRTSPLTGRLVWHIGDWGRASEHIGARWEHVAGALARERLGPHDYLVVLAATPALMAEVLASGLPHADALRTWREDGQLVLEPLDFKWSLETASGRQVSSETLQRLLAAELGTLETALTEARRALGVEPTLAAEPRDGRFVAPVHPANQAALLLEPELPTLLLPRSAYAFGRLRGDLQKLGLPRTVLDSRGALGRAYAEVTREMASAIRAAGQELVASGVTTEAALDQLAVQAPRWSTIGANQTRVVAARLMAA